MKNILLQKKAIRPKAYATRKLISMLCPNAGYDAARNFLKYFKPSIKDKIALYWPMGYELDTRPLISSLDDSNISLGLPLIQPEQNLLFKKWFPNQPLKTSEFGTLSPYSSSATLLPNIIVVPIVAFDIKGNRLGRGGGHYDRTYAHLEKLNTNFLYVGFAYSKQCIDKVPSSSHDLLLDVIVTEKNIIIAEKK